MGKYDMKKPLQSKVSFALDKNCWVCATWMLHSTRPVTIPSRNGNGDEASPAIVECSNHFADTQHFLSSAKLSLIQRPSESQYEGFDLYNQVNPQIKLLWPGTNIYYTLYPVFTVY